jgi:hypothetical protein
MSAMKNDTQIIGLDIGRGYTKAYSEFNDMNKECLFKSVIGLGRHLEFNNYENPIYIETEGEEYFVGMLAEKEGYTPTRNSRDSKTTETVKKLVYAALNEVTIADEVKIMLGVPYKLFRKTVLNEVIETYKDKSIKIKDKIKGGYKDIKIVDISIFREGDAALIWEVRNNPSNNKPLGMISVGFRTTELSYFDKALKFNDKRSKTIEQGNRSALEYVQNMLENINITKDLNEIDSSTDYKELKEKAYKVLSERVAQDVEDNWINLDEMNIYVAGGTALNMEFDTNFKIVNEPQMATAKGLYLIGTKTFK